MRKGFTLVELSIVLIIIGLIIGGVMKGKDLINSAEQKKIYNTWIKGWEIAANTYQDRTGGVLGDGTVNAGTVATENGQMDNVALNAVFAVQARLRAVGLDVPVGNIATTDGGSYTIKGKYITSPAVASLNWSTTANRNILLITAMPTDVALAFDKMTDGTLDATEGAFRRETVAGAWPIDAETTTTVNVSLEF